MARVCYAFVQSLPAPALAFAADKAGKRKNMDIDMEEKVINTTPLIAPVDPTGWVRKVVVVEARWLCAQGFQTGPINLNRLSVSL